MVAGKGDRRELAVAVANEAILQPLHRLESCPHAGRPFPSRRPAYRDRYRRAPRTGRSARRSGWRNRCGSPLQGRNRRNSALCSPGNRAPSIPTGRARRPVRSAAGKSRPAIRRRTPRPQVRARDGAASTYSITAIACDMAYPSAVRPEPDPRIVELAVPVPDAEDVGHVDGVSGVERGLAEPVRLRLPGAIDIHHRVGRSRKAVQRDQRLAVAGGWDERPRPAPAHRYRRQARNTRIRRVCPSTGGARPISSTPSVRATRPAVPADAIG